MPSIIVDQFGNGFKTKRDEVQAELRSLRREIIKAKYDAAQTVEGNERHWSQADQLDPHSANSLPIRRKLRSRSRYETIENNPYLKGTILTVVGDTVKTGPTLKITDRRIPKETRRNIERRFQHWSKAVKLRQKIWRLRLAKIVDGEGFAFAFQDPGLKDRVKLNFFCVEADRVSSDGIFPPEKNAQRVNEIDGCRFDEYDRPLQYHLLNLHPGASFLYNFFARQLGGEWVDAKFVLHWFRQDRGWLRGIPEITPSLPLCALLRRYTLAVVRAAEVAADFSAIIETEGPPSMTPWTDGTGNQLTDDPFDVFPIEYGMITSMPWGYKLKQLESRQPGTMYDKFVDMLLREIIRPLLVPFNIGAGSSSDSNMASAVVDVHNYKSGVADERTTGEEQVLDPALDLWWDEAKLVPGYLEDDLSPGRSFLRENPSLLEEVPDHYWRWPRVGLDHTDPKKGADAIISKRKDGQLTDRDIQEEYHNRDVDDWREEVAEDIKFREENGLPVGESSPAGSAE